MLNFIVGKWTSFCACAYCVSWLQHYPMSHELYSLRSLQFTHHYLCSWCLHACTYWPCSSIKKYLATPYIHCALAKVFATIQYCHEHFRSIRNLPIWMLSANISNLWVILSNKVNLSLSNLQKRKLLLAKSGEFCNF